jgi:D-glycero-D-manno-heptose 1,7-bisphosphate phosphatase
VGDRCSDIGAANSAGLRQAFLLEGTENSGCGGQYLAVKSLAEVEDWLVAHTDEPDQQRDRRD